MPRAKKIMNLLFDNDFKIMDYAFKVSGGDIEKTGIYVGQKKDLGHLKF